MVYRYIVSFVLFLGVYMPANAQTGCTDPAATNYNPLATTNDGSCIYPVTSYSPLFRAKLNPIITETSGLVWTDGKLWTHNDSGNPAEMYSVDTLTGATLQTVDIDNYPNIDWEDITADSNYIYLGDHGNNKGTRTDLKVLKIAKADIGTGSVVHVNAQAIAFSYTDQTSFVSSSTNNFDCEALISIKDSLYIFTKDRGDMQTRVYKMPKVPGTYALTPYTNYNVAGLITGADYNSTTGEIVLIGYLSGHVSSFLWFLNDYAGDMFFSGNKRRIEIGSSSTEWQTEGVAWQSPSRIFISNETAGTIDASVYISAKPAVPTTAVKNVTNTLACDVFPNPASGVLYVDNLLSPATYTVTSIAGKVIEKGNLEAGNNNLIISNYPPGIYIINMAAQDGTTSVARFTKQ